MAGARNLIVCSDGTWNTPENEDNGKLATTNVYDFHQAILGGEPGDPNQLKFYREGVGSSGNFIKRGIGGALGYGISKDIKAPYQWLCENYQEGDKLFLIGFSRGSYTVRSLAGLITSQGLYDLPADNSMSNRAKTKIVSDAYDAYRDEVKNNKVPSGIHEFGDVRIHFLGVFDTVGALGMPEDFGFLRFFQKREWYTFHNTNLSDKVDFACHAVAIDEQRAAFTPTLWSSPRDGVQEIWFPGVHADVGGGYHDSDLGDVSMDWMMSEAEKRGLKFLPSRRSALRPEPLGRVHDSRVGIFKKLATRPRSVPNLDVSDALHSSVTERRQTLTNYWPTVKLNVGETRTVKVQARELWSRTDVFMDPDEVYDLEASGMWLDNSIEAGPDGVADKDRGAAYRAADIWAGAKNFVFRTKKKEGQGATVTERRHPEFNWFALIGAVASGQGAAEDKQPEPHQTFLLGSAKEGFKPEKSGYLYCYANDLVMMDFNNSGFLELKITRTS